MMVGEIESKNRSQMATVFISASKKIVLWLVYPAYKYEIQRHPQGNIKGKGYP